MSLKHVLFVVARSWSLPGALLYMNHVKSFRQEKRKGKRECATQHSQAQCHIRAIVFYRVGVLAQMWHLTLQFCIVPHLCRKRFAAAGQSDEWARMWHCA